MYVLYISIRIGVSLFRKNKRQKRKKSFDPLTQDN